jgi:serine/threonine-protein kinase
MHGEQTHARTAQLGVGDTFADHRIDGLLGQGGMGVVYRATDLRLNRAVALKIIKPELSLDDDFRRRFRRESELAASIRHPNVVTIYQAGDSDGRLYVTMDLIDGTDLRALLTERGRLDPATATATVSQIASALDAAHAHGLVHRDVKPANILVASAAPLHVYLTDFGLTKRTSSQSGLTKTGLFVGTLDYAAPEQIKGWPVDARTDGYALGCVLFEMTAGHPPFRRDNDMATLYAHMTEPPPALTTLVPGVPPALDAAVQRALAKEPDERYPSAGDLGRAVLAAAAGTPLAEPERTVATGRAAPGAPVTFEPPPLAPAPPAPTGAPAPPSHVTSVLPKQRSPWPLAIAIVVVLLVAGGIALVALSGGDNDTGGAQPPSAADQQQQAARQQQRQQGQVQPADQLRAPVEHLGGLLDLSAEGRSVTEAGDFQAAADNRREILGQLGALSVPADLEPSRTLFQQAMQASLQADQSHIACGTCPAAARADRRATFVNRRLVRTFNPFAQRYLQRSFDPDDI